MTKPARSKAPLTDEVAAFWESHPHSIHRRPVIAKVLNTSEAKLERDAWLGKGIQPIHLGRSVRYRKSDVTAYFDANRSLPNRYAAAVLAGTVEKVAG